MSQTAQTEAATMTSSQEPTSIFALLGGEPGVRRLVDAFYDIMDAHPDYERLRALHPQDMSGSRDKLFWFLCGWTGGPNHFTERFGHPRLRARHLPFSIGTVERDQWLMCMAGAIQVSGLAGGVQRALMRAFADTADWMRNRPES